MTIADWDNKFGNQFLIALTNEERRYLGICNLSPDWNTSTYCSKTNLWYTRVTAFFDGDVIVKAISEVKKVLNDGSVVYENYAEYDTQLQTKDRKELLPLTSRGKIKPLTAANINSVTPFGCCFAIGFDSVSGRRHTFIGLSNPRANKEFPIGEWNAVERIGSDADFHIFMNDYIASCRNDYFEKLNLFKNSQKITVKYKVGDIFRMELDRTQYCYGIITGNIRDFEAMPELPKKHSLRQLMMVPLMVRYYRINTEDPNLKSQDLDQIPLGYVDIVGDNDIIWGKHTIVDHKTLAEDDLYFNFVCTKIVSKSKHTTLFTQDGFFRDGLIPKQEYTLYIEWGFAQTSLRYDQLSEKLKEYLDSYSSPHGGVAITIDPRKAVPDEQYRRRSSYCQNLLNPENRDFLNEVFACLGVEKDLTFDQFAEIFGGLTRQEIIARMK